MALKGKLKRNHVNNIQKLLKQYSNIIILRMQAFYVCECSFLDTLREIDISSRKSESSDIYVIIGACEHSQIFQKLLDLLSIHFAIKILAFTHREKSGNYQT